MKCLASKSSFRVRLYGFTTIFVLLATSLYLFLRLRSFTNRENNAMICHIDLIIVELQNGGDREFYECFVMVEAGRDDVDFGIDNQNGTNYSNSTNHTNTMIDKKFMKSTRSYAIDLPEEFVAKNRFTLEEGTLFVSIPGGQVAMEHIKGYGPIGTHIDFPPNAPINVLDDIPQEIQDDSSYRGRYLKHHNNHRDLRRQGGRKGGVTSSRNLKKSAKDRGIGIKDLIVLRIVTDDAEPVVGRDEINEKIFDPYGYSFASQYDRCSFGELQFRPYDATSPVVELHLRGSINSFSDKTILTAARNIAKRHYGAEVEDLADHTIFCMPNGTSGDPYIAYSGVNSFFSVISNSWCRNPATMMHEVAHNLGLGHAYESGIEYDDETTLMGFSYPETDGPNKCFNGQNIWHLGWFQSRTLDLGSSIWALHQGNERQNFMNGPSQMYVQLATFVDFDKTFDDQYVLIKIGDYFLIYNRAKDFNNETAEYEDQVTIVHSGDHDIHSMLVGVLDATTISHDFDYLSREGDGNDNKHVFLIENYPSKERTLRIELCEEVLATNTNDPDYVVLSIGFNSGSSLSQCEQHNIFRSTPTPISRPPTSRPTRQPSRLQPKPFGANPTTLAEDFISSNNDQLTTFQTPSLFTPIENPRTSAPAIAPPDPESLLFQRPSAVQPVAAPPSIAPASRFSDTNIWDSSVQDSVQILKDNNNEASTPYSVLTIAMVSGIIILLSITGILILAPIRHKKREASNECSDYDFDQNSIVIIPIVQ